MSDIDKIAEVSRCLMKIQARTSIVNPTKTTRTRNSYLGLKQMNRRNSLSAVCQLADSGMRPSSVR